MRKNENLINDSIYDITYTNNASESKSFNYEKVILEKTLSNYPFKNKNLISFLEYINNILLTHINAVKRIRVWHNFAMNKRNNSID
jgi:hypothetical protein